MNKNDNMLEIERRFLIEYPDLKKLKAMSEYDITYIEQTYIKGIRADEDGGGYRVRKRGKIGEYKYTKTYKKDITPIRRIEIEEEISESEYENLLTKIDNTTKTIRKYRSCFVYEGKMFELDLYPFWEDRAMLEIELENEEEKFKIPEFIKVLKEITDDKRYRNRSIAKSIITEIF